MNILIKKNFDKRQMNVLIKENCGKKQIQFRRSFKEHPGKLQLRVLSRYEVAHCIFCRQQPRLEVK